MTLAMTKRDVLIISQFPADLRGTVTTYITCHPVMLLLVEYRNQAPKSEANLCLRYLTDAYSLRVPFKTDIY